MNDRVSVHCESIGSQQSVCFCGGAAYHRVWVVCYDDYHSWYSGYDPHILRRDMNDPDFSDLYDTLKKNAYDIEFDFEIYPGLTIQTEDEILTVVKVDKEDLSLVALASKIDSTEDAELEYPDIKNFAKWMLQLKLSSLHVCKQ